MSLLCECSCFTLHEDGGPCGRVCSKSLVSVTVNSMTAVTHVTMTRCLRAEIATVRITGGEVRGRRVSGPDGLEVRPTASKVRQAFFNILGASLKGCRFLDLCAGSGLMGIEALSRGAGSLVAVDEKRKLVRAIELSLIQLDLKGRVICADVGQALASFEPESFDVIFADPPYKANLGRIIVEATAKNNLLPPHGVLVIEHLKSLPPPAAAGNLKCLDQRSYGQTSLSFYRPESSRSGG